MGIGERPLSLLHTRRHAEDLITLEALIGAKSMPLCMMLVWLSRQVHLPNKELYFPDHPHALVHAGRTRIARRHLPLLKQLPEVASSGQYLGPYEAAQGWNAAGCQQNQHRSGHSASVAC